MTRQQINVSRLMLYLGWIVPWIFIRLLKQLYISTLAYIPVVNADPIANLAYAYIIIAFIGIVCFMAIPKRRPDLRFNVLLVIIILTFTAIELLLNAYLDWDTITWF